MKDSEITKFLVSFMGQIECVVFPAGVFDEKLYIQYETVWGPDWDPVSGLTSGTSQMAQSGKDPERVVFNMPLEMVFGSTNLSGWPQLILTVRAQNTFSGDSLRGYALVLLPPASGNRVVSAPLFRPQAASLLGEWIAWFTGRHPELADPKMLANGKENYLLRTESYGTVSLQLSMVSKDLRKLGYDNQAPCNNMDAAARKRKSRGKLRSKIPEKLEEFLKNLTYLRLYDDRGRLFKVAENDISDVTFDQIICKLATPALVTKGDCIYYKFIKSVDVFEQ